MVSSRAKDDKNLPMVTTGDLIFPVHPFSLRSYLKEVISSAGSASMTVVKIWKHSSDRIQMYSLTHGLTLRRHFKNSAKEGKRNISMIFADSSIFLSLLIISEDN